MANDGQKDFNKDKGMNPGPGGHDKGQHSAPGRGGDDLSTGGRSGGGVQGSQRGLDREDREREQPGSKQRDRGQN
jgi:hypothetical protein